jgi:hypothetical protein
MLNRFLSGKKKYSVFIATFLVAVLQMFVVDPETQKELMDFVPTLAMMLSGIVYLVVEGRLDGQRAEAEALKSAEYYKTHPEGNSTQTITQAQPAASQQEIQPISASQPQIPKPPEPLDIKLFHERVLNDTAAKYSEQNPATVFFEARDKGSVTTCHNIKQAQDYWDYLVTLAYDAEQFVKEQTSGVKPGEGSACKVRSPEYVAMQLDLMKTLRNRDAVYALARTNIDWRQKLYPNDTLYHVGVLAEELLQYNT